MVDKPTEITKQVAVAELFGKSTGQSHDWKSLIVKQICPFTEHVCFKVRKSSPEISIGSCVVRFGREYKPLIVCPKRFLANGGQVFTDCLHLLTNHEPGNELHVIPEVSIPGGSVDYFLVSAKKGKPIDFTGIEFQGLDTTGTVWPHRQQFLASQGIKTKREPTKSFGVNWKMTAKTTLVQLHHKIQTFESVNRKLVLVLQQDLMDYMTKEFSFGHLENARLGDSMQFHPYKLESKSKTISLVLGERKSTDMAGIGQALSLGQSGSVAIADLLKQITLKMSNATRWSPLKKTPLKQVDEKLVE